jgi:mono/diheme cytochrome c family protein
MEGVEPMLQRLVSIDRLGRRGVALAAGAATVAVLTACHAGQAGRPDAVGGHAAIDTTGADLLARGEYLAEIAGCNDCHTPLKFGPNGPELDMSQHLAGHPAGLVMPEPPKVTQPWLWVGAGTNTAFAGPWGVSYAINLTSDEETGIGLWSEQVFVNALKTGRHMGVGRPILPPMPWPSYAKMSDEDLKALFAYLKQVPPKKNKVPDPVIVEPPAAPTP